MKRKIILIMMTAFMLSALSGCKIADSGLDEGEMNQVAEYTAKLLLKHTRGYEPNLLEHIEVEDNPSLVNESFEVIGEEKKEQGSTGEKDEIEKGEKSNEESQIEETDEKSEGDTEETGKDNSSSVAKQLSDIYGMSGLEAVFGGAGNFSKYPQNEGYFSLVPPDGMKLFVATIILKNISSKELHFVHDKDVSYALDFYKKGKIYKPSVTLLERDMKFLDLRLKAGASVSGVIVFNIPDSIEMKDVNLIISGKGKKYELSVSQ